MMSAAAQRESVHCLTFEELYAVYDDAPGRFVHCPRCGAIYNVTFASLVDEVFAQQFQRRSTE